MITRILKIRDFRGFKNWSPEVGLAPFADINLVYGANGSGKSTLASLLREALSDDTWATGLEVDITDGSGSRHVNSSGDSFWQTVRVFNRDYVLEHLNFDEAFGGTAESLLVLGKENVDSEQTRKRCQQEIDRVEKELPKAEERLSATEKKKSSLLRDRGSLIASELSSLGGRYNPRSYDAKSVLKELSRTADTSKISIDIEKDLQIVNEQSSDPVAKPDELEFTIANCTTRVWDVLDEVAISKELSDLAGHYDRQSWVERGLTLHEGLDDCIYCRNAIGDTRKKDLDSHFDESMKKIQSRISQLTSEITGISSRCTNAMRDLPKDAELLQSIRNDFVAARKELEKNAKNFQEAVNWLLDALEQKSKKLFEPQKLTTPKGIDGISLASITKLIDQHNEAVNSLSKRRLEAGRRVELSRIEEIRKDYEGICVDLNEASKQKKELEESRRTCEAEVRALSQDNFDAKPLARRLNSDLGQLLGRDDLRFMAWDKGYRIERNGSPASHLSEGERNAISLLYFLCSLSTHDTDSSKCVIVIDDPVSSLDGNALAGASAHLWSELTGKGKCGQVILLTHNFDLFRMWATSLDYGEQHIGQKYEIYEIRTKIVRDGSGAVVRTPRIIGWPTNKHLRKRLRSEYHYLFWRAAQELINYRNNPTIETEIEIATIFPNVCRRLLEAFLGFKAPDLMGNLHDQVMKTSKGKVVHRPTRSRILRFLQSNSHMQEGDTTRPVGRPESIQILNAVFEFIKEIDRSHFESMCRAVDIAASDLEAAVVQESTEDEDDSSGLDSSEDG